MPVMDSTDPAWCRHDWQIYFDDPDTESCMWCGTERRNPIAVEAAGGWASSASA
jgi:hypothetical protein